MTGSHADRWHFAGRWYAMTLASDVHARDGMGLELEDVGPAPARGTVLGAFHHDANGEFTFTAYTSDPLPLGLIEKFLAEARHRLPPIDGRLDT